MQQMTTRLNRLAMPVMPPSVTPMVEKICQWPLTRHSSSAALLASNARSPSALQATARTDLHACTAPTIRSITRNMLIMFS